MLARTIVVAALVAAAAAVPLPNGDRPALNQEHIDFINSLDTTWKAGVNARMVNTPIEQVKQWLGVLPDYDKNVLPQRDTPVRQDIPTNFDAREAWSQCKSIAHIRDQGPCGSCWAFGGVEAMSDRICIASGQKEQVELSAEDLVSCCGFECGMGCNGGYPSGAWSYAVETGLVTENNYPYNFKECDHHVNGTLPPCPSTQPTPRCDKSKLSSTVYKFKNSYGVSSSDAAIQTEIMNNGPVEGAFSVYEDFLAYKSGVYQHKTGSMLGGHAIKIMGWGEENGTPYWLVANSWNEDWGDKGTFKILRGDCGINDGVVAGEPQL
jgi:cathepsin B